MQKYHQILEELWYNGKEFLNTKYSIMAGAMSWISEANLVSALSNAGIFGVIACSAMTPELLKNEIVATKSKMNQNTSFGVNLILLHPQIEELLQVCINESIQYIIFAGGLPSTNLIKTAKDSGIKVIGFAPSLTIAKKLIRSGIDALIIEGHEAGGHVGPVSTLVLTQEILPYIKEVPVFIAGGIGTGETVVNFLKSGAAGIQMGTIFSCAKESIAHPNFKKAFFNAKSRDAQVSIQISTDFPVIPVRALKNSASEKFMSLQADIITKYRNGSISKEEGQLTIEKFWAGALRKAVVDGDINNGSLMAGQIVGLVNKELSVVDIIKQIVDEALITIQQYEEEKV